MRYLLILLGGIVLGALLALMVANTLQQRSVYPRSVMRILQQHLSALRQARRQNECTIPAGRPSDWAGIANLAQEIEPAFAASRPVPAFGETSRDFATLSAKLAQTPPASCHDFDERLATISEACEDCHRSFR